MKSLHQRLTLYKNGEDSYTFTPADTPGAPSLTIQRHSGDIVLDRPDTRSSIRTSSVYGIVGLITLSVLDYVVVITDRVREGHCMGHDIFRATAFDILPISNHVSFSNNSYPVVEGHLLALLQFHLKGGNFLFSYGWDLTRRLQAQWETRESDEFKAMWETADERFFWNRYLQSRFIDITKRDEKQDLSPFILPVMYGTFGTCMTSIKGRSIELCLISRRSRHRAGTRYFRRGIDSDGHVANFNETEQIVLVGGSPSGAPSPSEEVVTKMSYVQVRGSVPVYWAEVNTLHYKPDVQIMDLQETSDALRKHLQQQTNIYGPPRLVSLVNDNGHEKPVKEAYERYVAEVKLSMPELYYTHFDFHGECKNMRWDRISVLTDRLNDGMLSDGYFHLDSSQPAPIKLQKGVVRTNCMDNLDRTNIVQSALGKLMLTHQLQATGILTPKESVDDFEDLCKNFRELWADMGDSIAKAYGGSGAMKADLTRTNKRTRAGKWEDGYKGTIRYLKNNFFDGPRQDAFDLFTGTWTPSRHPLTERSLVSDGRALVVRSMPYVAGFSLFMICAGLTLPRTSDYSLFYYFVIWMTLFSLALLFIFLHGMEYVAWPRLISLDDILHYDGPGFRSGRRGQGLGIRALRWDTRSRKRSGQKSHLHEIELGNKKRID